MKLYFVRHGKTEWNLEGRLQGAKGDSPLLKESVEQVRELGHYLSDTHFDLVFSSDLPRAKKTTELIMESQKPKAKVTYTKALREWQLGKLEGQKISLVQAIYPKEMDAFRHMISSTSLSNVGMIHLIWMNKTRSAKSSTDFIRQAILNKGRFFAVKKPLNLLL